MNCIFKRSFQFFLSFFIILLENKNSFFSRVEKVSEVSFLNSDNDFLKYPAERFFKVSSHFNLKRVNPVTGLISPHKGIDLPMPVGTSVLSVANGTVFTAKYSNIAGYFIVIHHKNRLITKYMHLFKLLVKPGQKVKKGERIGLSGNTGRTTGPHLHYEIWIGEEAIDPLTIKF
ncbi:Cell wall endopeptidase, family M23/M37 [Candidatus Riesia pediculischaeffi PTSU]|uniref:Cell wall endopeptidase, family M23/M37 n=1 Tax=Candidatus Riesia pediculischaeffi PTSU TaxID=1401651 RepID=A0A0C1S113_9ENTR|nr:Cell wall endopeptidase, family M23/M37 [Candidatus Riesia pediculischaeffi PTSU]